VYNIYQNLIHIQYHSLSSLLLQFNYLLNLSVTLNSTLAPATEFSSKINSRLFLLKVGVFFC